MSINTRALRAPGGDGRVTWRGWMALVVLMLPVLLVSVDNTVLTFALPDIAQALRPTSIEQLWIVDAYSLVLAALLVTMGTLGDRFGRRRLLLIGATGFTAVSVLAAFAPTAALLIAARAALGVFGAMLMPSTLSLIRTIFMDDTQRRLAIAIWASGFSAGGALGPIVGGFLLEHFAWGSVFLMAVPVMIPLLVFAPMLVPETRDPNPGRIDPVSIVLSIAAMTPFVYGIKELAVEGPLSLAPVWFVVGIVFGVLFVRRQLRAREPMLDVKLFANPRFSGSVLVNLLSVFGLIGFLFFASQHLQLILGLSPMQSGLALLPGLVVMIIAGLAVVPIARHVAPRVIVPIALAFSVIGFVLSAVSAQDGALGTLIAAFVALGLGIGAAETISNDLILAFAPPAKAGAASAVSETAYELGAVLGTAVLGSVLTALYRVHLVVPSGIGADQAAAAHETLAGAMVTADEIGGTLGEQLRDAAAHAFDSGVLVTGLIGAGLIVIAGVIAATTLGGRSASSAAD
ncbi:MFS transporter [Microbacterium gorillae]|uniref:MFS transporter n=1 Tax=Microbacterium gorillae TaxID=1231063 RepID=UPI00058C27C3|nr:MFS transporter [Microbacterium gorillae]